MSAPARHFRFVIPAFVSPQDAPQCIDVPITVNGLTTSSVDLTTVDSDPTPTPNPFPDNPHNGEKLVGATVTLPAGVSVDEFVAYLQSNFRSAVLTSLQSLVPGLAPDHIYVTSTTPHTSAVHATRSNMLHASPEMLSVGFFVSVPASSATNVTAAMGTNGTFVTSIGACLEQNGVIPPGTANDVTVSPGAPYPSPSTGPGNPHNTDTATIAGATVGAVGLVAIGSVLFVTRKRWYRAYAGRAPKAADERDVLLPVTDGSTSSGYHTTQRGPTTLSMSAHSVHAPVCGSCGSRLEANSRFCDSCGNRV
jgi:hypothetical protein